VDRFSSAKPKALRQGSESRRRGRVHLQSNPMSPSGKADVPRYVLAILIAVAALFLRQLLVPLLGLSNPFHTAWVGVIFAAWYCGMAVIANLPLTIASDGTAAKSGSVN
jgi:hypothetical protein